MINFMYICGCHGEIFYLLLHSYGRHVVIPTPMLSVLIEHVYTVGLTKISHCHVAIT